MLRSELGCLEMKGGSVYISAITVKARFTSNFLSLKSFLACIPNFVNVGRGSALRYRVRSSEFEDIYAELGTDSICIKYYFDSESDAKKMARIYVFVTLVALLKDFYDVSMESLYPYIVEYLGYFDYYGILPRDKSAASNMEKRVELLSDANWNLSKEIIRLDKISREYSELNADLLNFSKRVFEYINKLGDLAGDAMLRSMGVERALLERISSALDNYR